MVFNFDSYSMKLQNGLVYTQPDVHNLVTLGNVL